MKRSSIVIANWKMYKTVKEVEEYISTLASFSLPETVDVFLSVPFPFLAQAVFASRNTSFTIGAQNMHDAEEGAFTGEVSARMLESVGAKFVLLGHSERRHLFGETDLFISHKLKKACMHQLVPILCIGETEKEREEGRTEEVLEKQLSTCLQAREEKELFSLIIAYEPVWAIGTGKTATAEIAEKAHKHIRSFLAQKWSVSFSNRIPLLYGGSIKKDNIDSLMSIRDIDGALVGGSSLEVNTFAEIIRRGVKL